jgi:ubiquinone/menaquinone biosynthesis C-methylase UbiE/DNA-binding transcriptional ArsR family regulator
MMTALVKSLRVVSDPVRLRLLLLVEEEELSVAELQELVGMGQSRISMHLSQLKQAELVEDRRSGKNVLYRMAEGADPALIELLRRAAKEIPEARQDRKALELILQKRQDKTRQYFNEMAGKFGRHYVPGRSWKGLAETLLLLMPPMVIADLGAGEGYFTQLLARRAKKVIAVDNSEKMVEVAAESARRNGLENVEFRHGDMEDPPIKAAYCDVAFFSQSLHHAPHPQRAVNAAAKILKPGGRIVILDLKKHSFENARELYADLWLGFSELELETFLRKAGFGDVTVYAVHREEESPNFETCLAMGVKP